MAAIAFLHRGVKTRGKKLCWIGALPIFFSGQCTDFFANGNWAI
jgi:hypothetical protein